MIKKLWLVCLITFWITVAIAPAFAQQTIIIVPSADTLQKGQIYPRIAWRYRPFTPDRYSVVIPSLVYGLTNKDEVFSQIAGLSIPRNAKPIGDLAYKHVSDITNTTKWTSGIRIGTSLSETIIPTNFIFTHLAQTIPYTQTRLTAGGYASAQNKGFYNKAGVLLGVEQYLIPGKLQLNVDWISGKEPFSAMGVGFKIKPGQNLVFILGVLIPTGKTKFGFIFGVGKVFR